jgi:regulatory protein
MKITGITAQTKNDHRVNVMVNGTFRFSLDVFQLSDLGIRVGKDYSEEELQALESESIFGKLYGRALEYCLMRPHSAREVRDYLYRKTRDTRTKTGGIKKGVPPVIADRVFERLSEKGYINDEKFARYWVENRNMTKGSSRRKLEAELRTKGIEPSLVEQLWNDSERSDEDELQKIITKKRNRYPDDQKFMQYLARQGFGYDDIKRALSDD